MLKITDFEKKFIEKFKQYYGSKINKELIDYVLDNCDILYYYNEESCDYSDEEEYENLLFAIIEEDKKYYYLLNTQIDYYTTDSQAERLIQITPDRMIDFLRLITLDNKERIKQLENEQIEIVSNIQSFDKKINDVRKEYQVDLSKLERFNDYQVLVEMYDYYKNVQPFRLNRTHSDHRSPVYKFSPKSIYWDGSGTKSWKFRSEQGQWNCKELDDEEAREIYLKELNQLIDEYKGEFSISGEGLFK